MRFGKKKQPTYRIVVTDQRNARNGEYIEKVGFYNPIKGEIKIEKEKIDLWVKKGAQLAESVKNLLKKVK
jgi:small subunit ribosomal protein S16